MVKTFVIDERQLLALEQAAKRLYTETRLDGNEMRDLAHTLTSVVRTCRNFEIPEDL